MKFNYENAWKELKRRLKKFEVLGCVYPETVIKEMKLMEEQGFIYIGCNDEEDDEP